MWWMVVQVVNLCFSSVAFNVDAGIVSSLPQTTEFLHEATEPAIAAVGRSEHQHLGEHSFLGRIFENLLIHSNAKKNKKNKKHFI
jgi:hypothetical protein